MMTKRIRGLALSVVFLFGTAAAVERSAAWKSLVEAERSFAKAAAEKGIRASFLEFLAPEAIVFRPQPVAGRPFYEKASPDSPTLLVWRPEFAEISAAGELGYTTGPYEVFKDKQAKQPSAYGHYITLWKKQADGAWKAVLDTGVSHGSPGPESAEVQAPSEPGLFSGKNLDPAELEKKKLLLLNRETVFARTSEANGPVKAYESLASDEIRLYREGLFPAVGRPDAARLLAKIEPPASWSYLGGDVSISDDLTYAYGTGTLGPRVAGGPAAPGDHMFSFLRIWRKVRTGAWRIVLDIVLPYPEK